MAACSPWQASKGGGDEPNLEGLSDTDALDVIAHLIYAAGDASDLTFVDQALALADQLEAAYAQKSRHFSTFPVQWMGMSLLVSISCTRCALGV